MCLSRLFNKKEVAVALKGKGQTFTAWKIITVDVRFSRIKPLWCRRVTVFTAQTSSYTFCPGRNCRHNPKSFLGVNDSATVSYPAGLHCYLHKAHAKRRLSLGNRLIPVTVSRNSIVAVGEHVAVGEQEFCPVVVAKSIYIDPAELQSRMVRH